MLCLEVYNVENIAKQNCYYIKWFCIEGCVSLGEEQNSFITRIISDFWWLEIDPGKQMHKWLTWEY